MSLNFLYAEKFENQIFFSGKIEWVKKSWRTLYHPHAVEVKEALM